MPRPKVPVEERIRRGTYRADRDDRAATIALVELAPTILETIGLSPRRRLLAGEEVLERTDGDHFARFCAELCTHSKGSFAGKPFVLEEWELAFWREALRFRDDGSRVYRAAIKGEPRKNGKSTEAAAASLYLASPAEGEAEATVIIAAGSRAQAAAVFEQAKRFVETNATLERDFLALKMALSCSANLGTVQRVSADGKLQHGLNPSAIVADELHAWLTPKQQELWAALSTAMGARDDGILIVITTAGWDPGSILGQLYRQARESPAYTPTPTMGPAGFVTDDEEAGLLVHWYGIHPDTPITKTEAFVSANPASWRTRARIEADLRDPLVDGPTKIRLYGNGWTAARERWIPEGLWLELAEKAEPAPNGVEIAVGVDAARTRDTTACAWAWREALDGERHVLHVRCKVWSTRRDVFAHELVNAARIDNDEVADFIRLELARSYSVRGVFYDERFFSQQADDLDLDGFTVVELHQGQVEMEAAWNEFYGHVIDGRLRHPGDNVLDAHVAAASGQKVERGWKVRKMQATNPIDALAAAVMATWGAEHHTGSLYEERGLTVL